MKRLGRGITRYVVGVGPYAIKLPWGYGRSVLRGWLANRSEWRQRHCPDVNPPFLTLGHFVLVSRRAEQPISDEWWEANIRPWLVRTYCAEESKPCSWGLTADGWRLIDFDRAWHADDRGLIGGVYYGRQERMARRWMRAAAS